jgi:hypothetical protein
MGSPSTTFLGKHTQTDSGSLASSIPGREVDRTSGHTVSLVGDRIISFLMQFVKFINQLRLGCITFLRERPVPAKAPKHAISTLRRILESSMR